MGPTTLSNFEELNRPLIGPIIGPSLSTSAAPFFAAGWGLDGLRKEAFWGREMATMESLIGLVNRIQRASTVLGDFGEGGAPPILWEALPSVAVIGGRVGHFCYCRRCLFC